MGRETITECEPGSLVFGESSFMHGTLHFAWLLGKARLLWTQGDTVPFWTRQLRSKTVLWNVQSAANAAALPVERRTGSRTAFATTSP